MRQFFSLSIEFMATILIFTLKKNKTASVAKKIYTIAQVLPTYILPVHTLNFINFLIQ